MWWRRQVRRRSCGATRSKPHLEHVAFTTPQITFGLKAFSPIFPPLLIVRNTGLDTVPAASSGGPYSVRLCESNLPEGSVGCGHLDLPSVTSRSGGHTNSASWIPSRKLLHASRSRSPGRVESARPKQAQRTGNSQLHKECQCSGSRK